MAPKRGTFFLLLIVACAALAESPDKTPGKRLYFKSIAKKLMKKCQDKGYPLPKMKMLTTVFNNSDLPMEDRDSDQSNTFLSSFMTILNSVSHGKDSLSRIPSNHIMTNMNCSNLPSMIKQMQTYPESTTCYMRAFMAPLSWEIVTTECENGMDSDDCDTLLLAAKAALPDIPPTKMKLPINIARQRLKKMMKMLREVYESLSEQQRALVVKWVKQQIMQNYFNCTMMPPSDSRLQLVQGCKSSLKWLNLDALTMMGPYLSYLTPNNVDSSSKETLCEFFRSSQSKSTLRMDTKMSPSLARRLLQTFQECFKNELAEHLNKLGMLACYYDTAPDLTPDHSRKLLTQLNDCKDDDNPKIKKLRKRLVKSMMTSYNITEALLKLGSSAPLLSHKQLSMISWNDLKAIYKNLSVQWTPDQMRTLVKKWMGNKTCNEMLGKELMDVQSIAGGLPCCVLKHIKAQEILKNTEALKNISKMMRKGQLKAMLHGLHEAANSSELVKKLSGALLRSLSLSNLAKANITTLEQVEHKIWRLSQALYLAKKLQDLKTFQYRRLHSVLQGITCKMINKVADSDVEDMAQAIAESPQWLSKMQVGCAARRYFAMLETKRAEYFKNITEEEMDEIPTLFLLHLPPSKVKDLPASVCTVFLDKMEMASLSLLPLRSPSRRALLQRALLCLGNDSSRMTTENVSRLGPLLCELKSSQLRLMAPDVLNSSLQAMASCQHIPQRHRADLIQLVTHTFGDPSDWSAEVMEELGLLLLWDGNATSALPDKTWMKDVLYFLKSCVPYVSDALKKKLFVLTTNSSPNMARKKRSANGNNNGVGKDNGNGNGNTGSSGTNSSSGSSTTDAAVPTVDLITDSGMNNVYWKPEQLDQMSIETFSDTAEILGNITDYSAEQLAVLSQKAAEAFGPVSEMTESEVTRLGCISQGFSNTDLEKLPFSLDTLEKIARCGWNELQMELMWKAIAEYNNLTVQTLGAAEIVALSQFICGLNSSEIGQLNLDAFKEAVDSMDGVQCSLNVTQQLKNLAVSAFGDPSTWTEAQVSDLSNIIAGLSATELASLDPSVFSFIKESAIPLIPPSNFAALSVAQLESLGPDNAETVTSEQRAALTGKQREALQGAVTGAHEQTREPREIPDQSGAPSLSVEGISAFMKPLLFLLTGFLLL